MNTADAIRKIKSIPELRKRFDRKAFQIKLAQMIRDWRKEADLSESQLAERAGITIEELATIESGFSDEFPKLETLIQLAHACGGKLRLGFSRLGTSEDSRTSAHILL